ncbi:hypothetical protein B296_00005568 [Ensete ventricosum]|uniref:Uncharacterized protein n=1 Tax=Ensete ventricosum TaxID=4639 RepID=A0A427AEM7_ENSVE|nr:hypothetical protein B296_00005568 [Ensete ventricosum]
MPCPPQVLADLCSHNEVLAKEANSDELVAARLATEKAKGAWEEEKNQTSEQERRVVASYKESKGYPELEVHEDPYAELPSDAEVPALTEVPFDDCSMSPLTLPPST